MQASGDPFALAKSEQIGATGPGTPTGAFKHPLRHLDLLLTSRICSHSGEFGAPI